MGRACGTNREEESMHTWRWCGKISSGRPRRISEDNIGMDSEELCWEVTEGTDRSQFEGKWWVLANAGMNFWVQVP